MFSSLFGGSRASLLLRAILLIAVIAIVDWRAVDELPLGFLYLLPMLMMGRVLNPWQIAGAAMACTILTELFDEFVWNLRTGVPRDVLYFTAYFCVGLFVFEVTRNRRIVAQHVREIETQRDARRDAEQQLRVLIESSSAAILTADSTGCILMANEAAHRMLGVDAAQLPGRSIHRYFPSLANVSRRDGSQQLFRAVMQSHAQQEDGEVFLADICFSTYLTESGSRLAAIILDASEDLRTREEASLHQMLAGSRIAMAAVSHEIRNVCGAIAVVHQNLSRSQLLAKDKDFEALGSLVHALETISAVELLQASDRGTEVDLLSVLDDLRIVVAPLLRDEGIECTWEIDDDLSQVWADRATLMQVFLNLITNSRRALSQAAEKTFSISVKDKPERVLVEVRDSGGGVEFPERLFHPFQEGAKSTGLGVFLSRAFMRAFGGDLRYTGLPGGACFIVELLPVRQFDGVQ